MSVFFLVCETQRDVFSHDNTPVIVSFVTFVSRYNPTHKTRRDKFVCLNKHHGMKTSGGATAQLHASLTSTLRWHGVICFTPRGQRSRCVQSRRLGTPSKQPKHRAEEQNLSTLLDNKLRGCTKYRTASSRVLPLKLGSSANQEVTRIF